LLPCAGGEASVYGRDDRQQPGAGTAHRFPYVGLLFAPGGRATAGTATLVTGQRILTAAHVVFDDTGALRRPLAALRFRTGSDFVHEPYVDFEIERVVAIGHHALDDSYEEQFDWAVLALEPHAGAPEGEHARLLPRNAAGSSGYESHRVEIAAFHHDVADGLRRVATRCTTLAPSANDELAPDARQVLDRSGVLAHDCDASRMSSGAGLFVRRDGRSYLAAIHVGKLGPERARTADLSLGHFNVAIEIGDAIRRAIEQP
jgi:hypothetical protein